VARPGRGAERYGVQVPDEGERLATALAAGDQARASRRELVQPHGVARLLEQLSEQLRAGALGALRIDGVDPDDPLRQLDRVHAAPSPKYALRTSSFSSSSRAVPRATTRPLESTYPSCAMANVWWTFCSTRNTVTPDSFTLRSTAKFSFTKSGDRPSDGSSTRRSFGALIRPRPIDTIACSPPDMVPAICERRCASAGNMAKTRSIRSVTMCASVSR